MEAEGAGAASQREFDRALRWAAICEWSDDAIIGWTLGGVVTSWNSGAERMYGYTADEITGRNVSVLIPPGGGGEFAPVVDQLIRLTAQECGRTPSTSRRRHTAQRRSLGNCSSPPSGK
jgi:PAS domain S-box-containing protein